MLDFQVPKILDHEIAGSACIALVLLDPHRK